MAQASEGSVEVTMRQHVTQLEEEVHRLQRRLGDLHCTEVNALRRAYRSLCQHVDALEQEADGVAGQLAEFEMDVVTPDLVANELGTAASLTVGLSVVHQVLKVTPLAKAGWLFRGMWALGGAYVLWRLTAGTLARMLGMLARNSERKRQLEARLQTVEDRIHIMAALLNWAEAQPSPAPTPSSSTQALQQLSQQEAQQAQQMQHTQQAQQCRAAWAGQEPVAVPSRSVSPAFTVPPHLWAGSDGGPGSPKPSPSPPRSPRATRAVGTEAVGDSKTPHGLEEEASQGAASAAGIAGTAQQHLPPGMHDTRDSSGIPSHSPSSSHASLPGAGDETGASVAPDGVGVGQALSPSRSKSELPSELEGLRRYAQLASPSGKVPSP